MATKGRGKDYPVIDRLVEQPAAFSFFQAARLLERLAATADPREEQRLPVGGDADPPREAIKFKAAYDPSFSAAEVGRVETSAPRRPGLTTLAFGLTGPAGVLPDFYTDAVHRTVREKNYALRDFLDLFNHRLAALFYRAWAKYRLPIAFERALAEEGGDDDITAALSALVGLGEPGPGRDGMRSLLGVDGDLPLFFGGHVAREARPAIVIEAILTAVLNRPVRVTQFRGAWVNLPASDQSRLGNPDQGQGQFAVLGGDFVVGGRVWEVQGGIRLHIGPLSYDEFRPLMPGGPEAERLRLLMRLLVGADMDVDYALTLKPDQVPAFGFDGATALGWNSWVGGAHDRSEPVEVIFRLRD